MINSNKKYAKEKMNRIDRKKLKILEKIKKNCKNTCKL